MAKGNRSTPVSFKGLKDVLFVFHAPQTFQINKVWASSSYQTALAWQVSTSGIL